MSKRLIRIKPSEIKHYLSHLKINPFNAVLANGNTVFGRLSTWDEAQIEVKDTRDHLHRIPVSDLYELVYDDSKAAVPPSRHATI